MLFITCMLYKAVLLLSMWMKSQSVTTEIKALDQYFSAQLIIFLSFPTFKFTKFTLYLLLCASFPSSTILSFHRYHWRYRADLSTPLASSFSSSVCHELPSFFPFLYFSFMFHLIHWHCGDLLCHNPREETFQLPRIYEGECSKTRPKCWDGVGLVWKSKDFFNSTRMTCMYYVPVQEHAFLW